MSAAEYDRAAELWPTELTGKVTNLLVIPTWLPGEERFWFKHESLAGHEFVVVDAPTGQRKPAFDHQLVARALAASPDRLPITEIEYRHDGVLLRVEGRPDWVHVDLETGECHECPDTDPNAFRGPNDDEIFVRDHNAWLRTRSGAERQLTFDGTKYFGWAECPDEDGNSIFRDVSGSPRRTLGCFWAPDGTRILVPRVDERSLTEYPYLENVPHDGSTIPDVHYIRKKRTGDAAGTVWDWHVIRVDDGAMIRVRSLAGDLQILPWHAWWTDRRSIIALASNTAQDAAAIVEIDADTGDSRILYEEHDHMLRFNSEWFHDDNVRYLPMRHEMLWFTMESGWPHLSVVDLASGAIRPVTRGEWTVQDVVRVTQDHVFFTAGGVEPGRNPYLRALYRVDLYGDAPNAGLLCLTPEDADHAFPAVPFGSVRRAWEYQPWELHTPMSPSGRYFVDNISRVDLPPVVRLRDASGGDIAELARADVSGLASIGWTYPETFCAKAADGCTDIYGVIVKPRRFAEQRSWPVLERIYGGHQVLAQPRSFLEGLNGMFMFGVHSLAEMGFAVVLLDGPGTPVRSRAFRDMTWDVADRFGIAHHRAAIEDAARTRPWMDLSCVGISGHSSGGYGTIMAMLLEPDFYKVGFASSPALDPDVSAAYIMEPHFGRPDYGGGRAVRRGAHEAAENYRDFAPSTYSHRLEGMLTLAYSDLDEQIEPSTVVRFIDALVAADKDFDLILLPGRDHSYTTEPYYQKRLWDYFLEHVQHRSPLPHLALPVKPGHRLRYT